MLSLVSEVGLFTMADQSFANWLFPKVIICDQDTNNQRAFKLLNITEDKPYFYVDKNKIVSLYDTPHILKSIRNNLLGNNFIKGENIISFNNIKTAYNVDKKNCKSRALLKITDAYINRIHFKIWELNWRLSFLANVASMRTYISTNELKSNTASDTGDFINKLLTA